MKWQNELSLRTFEEKTQQSCRHFCRYSKYSDVFAVNRSCKRLMIGKLSQWCENLCWVLQAFGGTEPCQNFEAVVSSQDNRSIVTRNDYDYATSSFVPVPHECSENKTSFRIGKVVSFTKPAGGWVSNFTRHLLERQKDFYRFSLMYTPSHAFSKSNAKWKPEVGIVATLLALKKLTKMAPSQKPCTKSFVMAHISNFVTIIKPHPSDIDKYCSIAGCI